MLCSICSPPPSPAYVGGYCSSGPKLEDLYDEMDQLENHPPQGASDENTSSTERRGGYTYFWELLIWSLILSRPSYHCLSSADFGYHWEQFSHCHTRCVKNIMYLSSLLYRHSFGSSRNLLVGEERLRDEPKECLCNNNNNNNNDNNNNNFI